LNVSRSTLFEWERRGCPVGDGDEAILAWAMKASRRGFESDDIRTAKLAVLHETARRLRLANEEKAGNTLSKPEIHSAISKAVNLMFATLDRYASVEWPVTLKGLVEAEISTKVKADIERIKDEFRSGLRKLSAEEGAK
jgi:hypothetical protein